MLAFFGQYWAHLLPVLLALAGIYLLLPRARPFPVLWGALLCALALVMVGLWLVRAEVIWLETLLFSCFAGLAIIGAVLMLAQQQPVHAALSFALVILSTCGLFLLQAAPFLMAATIVVYAGAIVVTFLFVIMLAQQTGQSSADQRSREPFLATVAGLVLLAALLVVLHRATTPRMDDDVVKELDSVLKKVAQAESAVNKSELDVKLDVTLDEQPGLLTELNIVYQARNDKELKTLKDNKGKKKENQKEIDVAPIEPGVVAGRLKQSRDDFRTAIDDLEEAVAKLTDERITDVRNKLLKVLHAGIRLRLAWYNTVVVNGEVKMTEYSGTPTNKMPPFDNQLRAKMPAENVAGLGRTLFTDYLLALQLAGTLLLVATIGAIAISARRTESLR